MFIIPIPIFIERDNGPIYLPSMEELNLRLKLLVYFFTMVYIELAIFIGSVSGVIDWGFTINFYKNLL